MARALAVRRTVVRPERGAAAVEFAIIAPLLLLLLFGIISYGYMLSYRQGLSQGAAEGARAAAVALPSAPEAAKVGAAVSAVNEALGSYGVTCEPAGTLRRGSTPVGTCRVTIAACSLTPSASCATVSLAHDYRDHPLLPAVPGSRAVQPDTLAYAAVAEVS